MCCGKMSYGFAVSDLSRLRYRMGRRGMPDQSLQSTLDRQIRVFISSTFRDMQEERNYLVKFTFPELRKLCESRGVVWGEVDLRWGVTDEESAEGKVLPICLEEIRRCKPYFIGLLGERYGWIPNEIPKDLLDREPWLKEHLRGTTSVTELEILQGVLLDPKMAGHAFFYFRDPNFIERIASDKRGDFQTEDSALHDKLEGLKQRIRQSGLPVRENFADAKALGELVLADLMKVIDERWPVGSEPDPLDREAMDHEAYARSRRRVYIGGDKYYPQLDAHVDGDGKTPLVIIGASGLGKSALLANWVERYSGGHRDVLVIQHYIGASPYSADWAAMLRRIMGEFKRKLAIPEEIPDNVDSLRSAFPNWLHMAAAKGRVVLVLDALNQLEDRDGAPDLVWLPPVMPANVRLFVSTLSGRPLEEINKRAWPTLKVEPLDQQQRGELIAKYLKESFSKQLNPARVQRIAATMQAENPLYLRVLLDELRLFGEHEKLDERIEYYLKANSLYEMYMKVIARWEEDYEGDSDLVGDTLSLLWASRRGLSEDELLLAIGSQGEKLPRAAWSPLYLAMSDSLVSTGGLLNLAHEFLRHAVKDAYLPTNEHEERAHLNLATRLSWWAEYSRYVDEVPWQLAKGKAWSPLAQMLADWAHFFVIWNRSQFDLKYYWMQIESHSNLRVVTTFAPIIQHPESEPNKEILPILCDLLLDTGHPIESLRLRAFLTEYYKSTNDFDSVQTNLGNQSEILLLQGDLDGAMKLNKEKEQIARKLGRLDSVQRSLGNQAIIHKLRGDSSSAMTLLKEQEDLCRQQNNVDSLAVCFGNQAEILFDQGDLDGSIKLLKESEQIHRSCNDIAGLERSLSNQALILSARGDLDVAMALHKQGELLCRQLGNLNGLQESLGNQASILKARGDLSGAMAHLKEQERLCRQLRHPHGLAISLATQARVLGTQNQLREGLSLAEEAYRLATVHGYAPLQQQFERLVKVFRVEINRR
jgi:tetratricopeptide (TPR) repeat protein